MLGCGSQAFLTGGHCHRAGLAAHCLVQRGCSGEQQGAAQRAGHHGLHLGAGRADGVQDVKRDQGGGDAAGRQIANHSPVNAPRAGQLDGAAHLGKGGEQQVGAHRQIGLDAEDKNEDGRHQGTATDPGEPDNGAHHKTRNNKSQFMHRG